MHGLCKSYTKICYVISVLKIKINIIKHVQLTALHYLLSNISVFCLYNTKEDILK